MLVFVCQNSLLLDDSYNFLWWTTVKFEGSWKEESWTTRLFTVFGLGTILTTPLPQSLLVHNQTVTNFSFISNVLQSTLLDSIHIPTSHTAHLSTFKTARSTSQVPNDFKIHLFVPYFNTHQLILSSYRFFRHQHRRGCSIFALKSDIALTLASTFTFHQTITFLILFGILTQTFLDWFFAIKTLFSTVTKKLEKDFFAASLAKQPFWTPHLYY